MKQARNAEMGEKEWLIASCEPCWRNGIELARILLHTDEGTFPDHKFQVHLATIDCLFRRHSNEMWMFKMQSLLHVPIKEHTKQHSESKWNGNRSGMHKEP